jgi:hypothetical protein
MENLTKACLDYATPLMTVPKIYTYWDVAAAAAIMALSIIGMIWCLHYLAVLIVA